ncbi:hypothetical protein GCM10023185_29080 [Hymenobacter saemangeumensis]|uniref:Uncharacterized protein n=1 Tax=Hymenobacter saemangeumensis TaxID=1084522 RepID=A0ABP8ILH4_9BACT
MNCLNFNPARASDILFEWERTRPAGTLFITPDLRTLFNELVAEVVSNTQETNLDIADVQWALRSATSLSIGRGEASGPDRAHQALLQAYQNTHTTGLLTAPQGRMLLILQSRPDSELEMDELTIITEAFWRNAGSGWEMVFGHSILPNLAAEIMLMFLLAPHESALIPD